MDLHHYRAARDRAVFFDEAGRGRIVAVGADRASYFHGLLTNDIQALTAGAGCYAAYLTAQGRMISDMYVLELGDAIVIDAPASTHAELLARFDQFVFSEDVQLADATESFAQLSVVGPKAAAVVAAALQPESAAPDARVLESYAQHQNTRAAFRGERVIIARRDDYGVSGFVAYVPRTVDADFCTALAAAGAQRVERDVAETLRIEAGVPLFGVDMDTETIPLEAGIEDRAISFTKGCYVGQEVIIRVLHRGHGRVARRLVGLRVDGPVPARGEAIRHDEKTIGEVTSATFSPSLGASIALGYVHRDLTAPGTVLSIGDSGQIITASVVDLPFVSPVGSSRAGDQPRASKAQD